MEKKLCKKLNPIFKELKVKGEKCLAPFINSYKLAWKGNEKQWKVLFLWGGAAIFVYIFIIKRMIIDKNTINFINVIISLILMFYFLVHLVLIRKAFPKEPKLSKEEKKAAKLQKSSISKEEKEKIKIEKRKEFRKSLAQKLLLQKSFTKWSWTKIIVLLDLYVIADLLLVILKVTNY